MRHLATIGWITILLFLSFGTSWAPPQCLDCDTCTSAAACSGSPPGAPCGTGHICFDLKNPSCGVNHRCCGCRLGVAQARNFNPPVAIPDGGGGGGGIEVTLDVPPLPCVIQELDVAIDINHARIGDLKVTLQHGNVIVVLMDRPGFPQLPNGCDADLACGQPIYLSDGGAFPIECGANCATCFPNGNVTTGYYLPNEALAAFSGQPVAGIWQLRVEDLAQGSQGVLCRFELLFACQDAAGVPTSEVAGEIDGIELVVAPNPFNPLTSIEFNLPAGDHTALTILGADGRVVAHLHEGFLAAGRHAYEWDGRDANGGMAPSGAYLVTLRTSNSETTRKLMLLK